MPIDSPIEVESSCESLVGLLTRASSIQSSLPRVSTPVAHFAPALRAYSGVGRAGFAPASQINQTSRVNSAAHRRESSLTFAHSKTHEAEGWSEEILPPSGQRSANRSDDSPFVDVRLLIPPEVPFEEVCGVVALAGMDRE